MEQEPQTAEQIEAERARQVEILERATAAAEALIAKKNAINSKTSGEPDAIASPVADKTKTPGVKWTPWESGTAKKSGTVKGPGVFNRGLGKAKELANRAKDKSAEAARSGAEKVKGGAKGLKDKLPGKKPEEQVPIDPEKEVAGFIAEFELESILPAEFKDLTKEQKLLVIRQLKNRIVDLVRSDAQLQYSEDLKKKIAEKVKPATGKLAGILSGLKTITASARASVNKEAQIKDLEAKAFKELSENDEGKRQIAENMAQLTERLDKSEVKIVGNKPEIIFAVAVNKEGQAAVAQFNTAANSFREMPYEWGQGKGGNKKTYDKAKAEYEKARNEVFKIEEKNMGTEQAMTSFLQIDNMVQMDQLLNTHPEVEKEFSRIAQTAGGKEFAKTGWNFIQTMTGGKNLTNKALFVGGYGLRMATASLGLAVGVTAPITGAVIGSIRGKLRGQQTLDEREKQARHGTKDASKEKMATTDVTHLTKRLDDLMNQIENATTDKEKAKKISMLMLRIEHTQGKIEKGQVNFGDKKSELTNQLNFIDSINKALVMKAVMAGENNAEFKKRIDSWLKVEGSIVADQTSEAQNKFIKKQMVKGALMGAGFATLGYTVRYLGEHMGIWGGHGVEHAQVNTQAPHAAQIHQDKSHVDLNALHKATLSHRDHDLSLKAGSIVDQTKPDSTSIANAQASLDSLKTGIGPTTPGSQAAIAAAQAKLDALKSSLAAAQPVTPGAGVTGAAINGAPGGGHELAHNMEFKIKGPLDHAYEKLVLDHNLPGQLPKEGIVLDQEGATRALNEAANMVRLTEGHGAAGVTVEQFNKAFSYHDGVLKVLDFKEANHVMDQLHAHSAELVKGGVFKDPESATGYVKNVDWLDKVHATDMHDTAAGVGTGIAGHPDVSASQIGDFSHIPDPHHIAVQKATSKVMDAMDTKSSAADDKITQDIKNRLTNEAPSVQNISPEDTLGHAQAAQHEVPMSGEKPGTYQPYNTPHGVDQSMEGEGTYQPYHQPYDMMNNPFQLSEEVLKQVNNISEKNIHHIFPEETDNMWRNVRVGSADDAIHLSFISNNGVDEFPMPSFVSYLQRLHDVTGLDPRTETLIQRAETNEEFIKRALQKAAQMGQLDKVKL